MKYFSMFSGIGGFEKGIEDSFEKGIEDAFNSNAPRLSAGEEASSVLRTHSTDYTEQSRGHRATCIGFSEIDKNAVNIYKKHYPGHQNYGSAFDINPNDLPDFDFLVGGFPCQAFSIAGKRLGFEDTRGTLFFEIARILREKRPANFLLENVKGLLSHDNGQTFTTIITTLAEMGYCVEWEVLNSKNFGVPQNRERVFIHGFREGCGRQIFPLGSADCQIDVSLEGSGKLFQIGNVDTAGNNSLWGRVYSADGVGTNLNANGGGVGAKTGLYAVRINEGVAEETADTAMCLDKSYHKGFDNHGQRTGIAVGCATRTRAYIGEEMALEVRKDEVSNALNHMPKDYMVKQDFRIRRLTPVECEALQGFPPQWTKYGADGKIMSDSSRYKACGNAVTTNVICSIIDKLFTIKDKT